MISFKSALNLIQKNVSKTLKSEFIDVNESFGRILASDLFSKCDYPRENLSSMDGVVIFKSDLKLKKIEIIGEIKAGDSFATDFKKGQSKLIFTGGIVPGKNKVIIPREQFLISRNELIINEKTGLLVDGKNRQLSLASGLKRLFEDPKLCKELGLKGRQKINLNFWVKNVFFVIR